MIGTDQNIGLAQEILTVLLGLEEEVLERVIRIIKDSDNIYDIKDNIVYQRIGNRATRYLRNAIEIARHEGIEKHEHGTETEPDLAKKRDIDQTSLNGHSFDDMDGDMDDETNTRRESLMFTFKDFLNEAEDVVTDPEDMSAEDLMARSKELRKQAAMKQSGRGEQAAKLNLRSLQNKLRTAKNPTEKADIQRRIKELMQNDSKPDDQQQAQGV